MLKYHEIYDHRCSTDAPFQNEEKKRIINDVSQKQIAISNDHDHIIPKRKIKQSHMIFVELCTESDPRHWKIWIVPTKSKDIFDLISTSISRLIIYGRLYPRLLLCQSNGCVGDVEAIQKSNDDHFNETTNKWWRKQRFHVSIHWIIMSLNTRCYRQSTNSKLHSDIRQWPLRSRCNSIWFKLWQKIRFRAVWTWNNTE